MTDKNPNFDERLDKALNKREEQQAEKDALSRKGQDMSMAWRVIMELVLSIVICAGLGYWIDTKIGTAPLFILIGILLGTVVGFMTVYKMTNNMGYAIGFTRLHSEKKDAKSMVNKTTTDDD